jgi:hypothetical protein
MEPAMTRRLALATILMSAPLLSGCLAAKTAGVAVGAAGAAVGAAGEVAEGAVDIVTPDRDDDEDDSEERR